jgi:hypothetical protein
MNNIKFTAALRVISERWPGATKTHVTLAFCDVVHAAKIQTSDPRAGDATITAVQYWSGPDITVLLIDSYFVRDRHGYYIENGYQYEGHDFNPHITVTKGNKVEDFEYLIGRQIGLGDEYIRLLDVNVYASKRNVS